MNKNTNFFKDFPKDAVIRFLPLEDGFPYHTTCWVKVPKKNKEYIVNGVTVELIK